MTEFNKILVDSKEFYLDTYRHTAHLCENIHCTYNSDVYFLFKNLSGERIESIFMSMTEKADTLECKIRLLQIGLNLTNTKYEALNVEFLNSEHSEQYITLKTI